MTLAINACLSLDVAEVQFSAIRAQGAGGQNVNKVASALHLRFDSQASSLPVWLKERLLAASDSRISNKGVVVIKGQQYRTQEQNRTEALSRLVELLQKAAYTEPPRRATRPTLASKKRRLEGKTRRSDIKSARAKPDY